MAKIICTRTVYIHKPKDQGGMTEKIYYPGDAISDDHFERISPQLRPKCTNMGISAEEAHEAEVAAAEAAADEEPEEDANPDGLDSQKVSRLRAIAQDEGVEVVGAAKKANLIAAIRAHREG